MSFSYEIKEEASYVKVSFVGNLINKQQVTQLLEDLDSYANQGVNKVIIDLSEMKYMNSTGLNILINIFTQTRSHGGEVIITNVPEKINKLLIITKLNNIFNIMETTEEAKKVLA